MMDNLVKTLTNSDFLIAVFAAISAAAVVFALGASLFGGGSQMKARIKRVALEREKMRAQEMARLRGTAAGDQATRTIRQATGKEYMKNVVDRFSLEKAFMDDNTVEKLSRAGYRSPSAVTTWLFLRFVTPIALFVLAFVYQGLSMRKPALNSAQKTSAQGNVSPILPIASSRVNGGASPWGEPLV